MTRVLILGDFCPIGITEKHSLDGQHDKIFNGFSDVLARADLRIANLECPIFDGTSDSEKFGPVLKARPETIETLKFGNFDLVTLANNHIMDQGAEGLSSTMSLLKTAGIQYVGAGNDLKEARVPTIITTKGKTIAIFNFAENEFSNTHGDTPGANPLSLASNFNDIQKYKGKADKVIVIVHGGNETYELPSPRFKETLRFFADCGADAVLAHHTHVVSGYEVHNNVPIFYGLGNFVFDYHQRSGKNWSTGIAVELLIDESVTFNIIPFFQNFGDADGVVPMTESESADFMKHLDALNKIIADDLALEARFEKFIEERRRQYSHFLEPYTNRILHGLFGRKIIPSAYSPKKKRLLLNLIRCESHRDIVIKLLSK